MGSITARKATAARNEMTGGQAKNKHKYPTESVHLALQRLGVLELVAEEMHQRKKVRQMVNLGPMFLRYPKEDPLECTQHVLHGRTVILRSTLATVPAEESQACKPVTVRINLKENLQCRRHIAHLEGVCEKVSEQLRPSEQALSIDQHELEEPLNVVGLIDLQQRDKGSLLTFQVRRRASKSLPVQLDLVMSHDFSAKDALEQPLDPLACFPGHPQGVFGVRVRLENVSCFLVD